MNFEEAVQEMVKGNKVRLSDWLGYWFIPYIPTLPEDLLVIPPIETCLKLIAVFTREGDIIHTPNIERYKDRDDWEVVTETGWSFDMALRFMKNGKEVTRSGFPEYASMCILGGKIHVSIHLAGSIDTVLNGMLANDWQIVNL